MKLAALDHSLESDRAKINDLRHLLQQPSVEEIRPCPGCVKPCPCSQSTTCTCHCSPECEYAPFVMSSEPERYPIEKNILALVFGLNCLRVLPPYWSCEGHNFPSGEIFRVPQVWFYSRSIIYPKLIGEYVHQLKIKDTIHYPWHICLAYADNSLETGFSIEPDVKGIENPELTMMQKDVQTIADNLLSRIQELAKEYIRRFESQAIQK